MDQGQTTPSSVPPWRLSNTVDARFRVEALRRALAPCGRPEIFNTDQDGQFTSLDFTNTLKDAGTTISVDGRGRCMDNIFIERLRRSLKYEAVSLTGSTTATRCDKQVFWRHDQQPQYTLNFTDKLSNKVGSPQIHYNSSTEPPTSKTPVQLANQAESVDI